ncbi:hypothetical protein LZ30DRAFT_794029 [Colletotrichum cereale]|nr:hypothetical protein LZ30DRAFT_794029 [Colletotrichum cereale]
MVDRIDSYFPGRIIDRPKDDDGSTVYVSTDNGWTNDERSDAGNPGPLTSATTAATHSDPPNLIDFDSSDNGDIPANNDLTEKMTNLMDQEIDLLDGTDNVLESQSLESDPRSQTRSESNLDILSAGFTTNGSLCPSDDVVTSHPALAKQPEHEHETLKRENGRLDSTNERLNHRADKSDATIEKLKAQLSEAELHKCRAQKYAAEISERSKLDQEFLHELQEELDYKKTQLDEFKAKYNRVVQNQEPLHTRLQELQTGLLNAVERNKTYEAFLRAFVADNPQHTATFKTIGISPGSATRNNCVTDKIEEELLISFDEISLVPIAPHELPQSKPSGYAGCSLDLPSQTSTKSAIPMSYNLGCNMESPLQALQQDSRRLSPQPRLLCANSSKPRDPCDVNADALKWREDCNDIWESPFQRERALRNHQGATGARQLAEIPASRIVIMTGLPDEVHIERVLEHIRGGQILNAHTAPMGTGDVSYNHAYIEFTAVEDALEFYKYSRSREFGFITQGSNYSKSAGLAHNFNEVVTHFAYSDDGSFEISFSSLKSATLVRQGILDSSLWTAPPDERAVTFRQDPCSAPLGDLQVPFLPTYPTPDLSILAPENAQLFMTTEEREDKDKLLHKQMLERCDPNDPDTVGLKEMLDRKNIVWEKTADWDNAVEYMAYDPDQRKKVLHRRDRQSGAVQVWYHGGWAMDQIQSWKAWEHYNVDSPHPYTQKSVDLLYDVTSWVDRRKVNLYLKSKVERKENEKDGADNNVDRSSSMMAGFKETPNNR